MRAIDNVKRLFFKALNLALVLGQWKLNLVPYLVCKIMKSVLIVIVFGSVFVQNLL